jgi:hypothetical protein
MLKSNDSARSGRWSPLDESDPETPSIPHMPARPPQFLFPEEHPLSILVLTWNLMGSVPSVSDLERMLSK